MTPLDSGSIEDEALANENQDIADAANNQEDLKSAIELVNTQSKKKLKANNRAQTAIQRSRR